MADSLQTHYNDTFSEKWLQYLSPQEWRGRVRLEFVEVPITKIEHAGCLTDPDVVDGWVRALAEQRPIPPPIASLTERGTYYTHDGNHRLEALRVSLPAEASIRVAVLRPERGFFFARQNNARFTTWIAGLSASAVNIVAAAYLLLPPLGSFWVDDISHLLQLLFTLLAMLVVTAILSSGPFRGDVTRPKH